MDLFLFGSFTKTLVLHIKQEERITLHQKDNDIICAGMT